MHCAICDKILTSDEITFNRQHQKWDPCFECLEIINSVFEPLSEEEIDRQLSLELGLDSEEAANDNEESYEKNP